MKRCGTDKDIRHCGDRPEGLYGCFFARMLMSEYLHILFRLANGVTGHWSVHGFSGDTRPG